MALRRAIGAVKDQTSIGLAKVAGSDSLADLDVAIVKATSHEEFPSEERHIREILSLTCYSRAYIRSCVNTIARRLSKTKNWVVALKTLMLIQRLLIEGDPAYEQEIFFTTRRGTRLLNMSDFSDSSRSNSWDYSAFVRTYALYLDEMLEFRMQGKRRKHHSCAYSVEDDQDQHNQDILAWNTPVRELTINQILSRMHHLQQLLDRFLATKPTGVARYHRLVIVALYPAVNESFQVYYETTDILSILIDKFMELDIPDCVKVHGIFCRISKQFDELDAYYSWSKEIGIARCSEYPEVERITLKKLELMDEFIRDKAAANEQSRALRGQIGNVDSPPPEETESDMNSVKALPPPPPVPSPPQVISEKENENEKEKEAKAESESQEADLLHLGDDAPSSEEHGDKLALALFNGEVATDSNTAPSVSVWEAFNDQTDWETALVQSASYLPHQKASLGGGFDLMLLDGMYNQGATNASLANIAGGTGGSSSSVALGSVGNPHLLALPAPSTGNVDPFAPSLGIPPPPYVQMSELEKKQQLLIQEQLMWQQYQLNGLQGPSALSKAHPNVTGGVYRYGF